MGTCHQCGAVITEAVRFRDTCPSCQAYLHCCLNCRLYSPGAHNHCLSPTTEYVGDVAGANFCEEFEFTAWGSSISPKCPDISFSVKPVDAKTLAGTTGTGDKVTMTRVPRKAAAH